MHGEKEQELHLQLHQTRNSPRFLAELYEVQHSLEKAPCSLSGQCIPMTYLLTMVTDKKKKYPLRWTLGNKQFTSRIAPWGAYKPRVRLLQLSRINYRTTAFTVFKETKLQSDNTYRDPESGNNTNDLKSSQEEVPETIVFKTHTHKIDSLI